MKIKISNDIRMSTIYKLIKGTLWNSVSQFGSQAFNIVITILIARKLSPEDFGVFGMVVIFTSFIGYFSEFGLTAGLIQRKQIDSLDVNSVFWSTAVLSLSLYTLMFFGAPVISSFYGEPRLTLITRILFLEFLIAPLNFVPEALQTKKLEYGKITVAELFSVFFSGTVAVTLAYHNFGVWSLVWQDIVKITSRAIAILYLTKWKPKFEYSWKRIKGMLDIGVNFTFSNLLIFAFDNTDYLLVGKLLGANSLGLYTMAFRISKYPILKIQGIFGRMLFPAFSTFNDDLERIKRNYMRLLTFFLSWVTPALIFGYFVSEPLIHLLLGEKWSATVPLVRIFMIYLMFSSFCVQNQPVLVAINRLKTWNVIQLCATVMLAVTGLIGIRYLGLEGMAIAFTTVTISFLLIVFIILVRLIRIPPDELFRMLRKPLLTNAVLTGLLAMISFLAVFAGLNDWLRLILPGSFLIAWLLVNNRETITYVLYRLEKNDAEKNPENSAAK